MAEVDGPQALGNFPDARPDAEWSNELKRGQPRSPTRRRLVKQALADSPVRALICGAGLVDVVVKRAGREIGHFSSP